VEGTAKWAPFGNFTGMQILPMDDFKIDLNDKAYREQLLARFKDRLKFVKSRDTELGGLDKLPEDAHKALERAVEEMSKF
jgi:phosphoenolpyruvate carboxykinase (ATP)